VLLDQARQHLLESLVRNGKLRPGQVTGGILVNLGDLIDLLFSKGEEVVELASGLEVRKRAAVDGPVLLFHWNLDTVDNLRKHFVVLVYLVEIFVHLLVHPVTENLERTEQVFLLKALFADEAEGAEEQDAICGLDVISGRTAKKFR
jgi:hypothetical protein